MINSPPASNHIAHQHRLYESNNRHELQSDVRLVQAVHHNLIAAEADLKSRPYSVDSNLDLHTMNLARTSKIFHVVIIGGSFAGIRAAQDLENLLLPHMVTITVIERRDQYFYNLGALRSMAKKELIDLVWLPYDHVFRFSHNKVVQGEVASVYPNSVILKDGRKFDFDSLLVATGSIYPAPCKMDATSHLQGKAEQRLYFEMVKTADSILIIGGGPTGVGLAAEIATQYPSKKILLVHAGPRLMSTEHNSESMSRKAYKKLKSLGIKILLNERVIIPEDEPLTHTVECRWLKTSKGRSVFSNLQFLCNGITFDTSFMDTLDPVFKHKIIDSKTQQLRVLPTMQINHPELPWIFAAGDVCNTTGEKQAYRADSQGAHVAQCMSRMAHSWAQGNSRWFDVPLKQWHDPAQFMAIAMGPNAGITDTPWIVLGDLPTRIMKSRELFLARRYKEFNLEFPGAHKRSSRGSSTTSSIIDVSRTNSDGVRPRGCLNSGIHHSSHCNKPANDGVATDLSNGSYDLSKAVAKMAISAAGSLDDKFDSDRISLSRPTMRRAATNKGTYPFGNFYACGRLSETGSINSDGYSSEEDLDDIEELQSPAQLYARTAPNSRHGSHTNSSSHCSQSMFKTSISDSASTSNMSISTSTTESSATSRTPSITSTLLHGPVIPRQGKEHRTSVGQATHFRSHDAIYASTNDDWHSSAAANSASAHPLINTRAGSTATIHLEQYN
ncbi:hypothetical protein LPJ78_001185 [Coemansia sp. RSA 989]|nr:hypothetical protein BX667DRAFT_537841 [Coemansia mojavensis]KAJ1743824.1 hypothetical protein LPJ68_000631 [Coemansia sp. RSA 1086]KAJ1751788.1 hypothetical protein LPJ79_001747 [Coemansia sp. RSA 1821]KAJ1867239.1 hypothetical protein LPJ78_001185 [Coemansia sp. RSA 989]KAJ2674070.1 hypothetical protein IWW42_001890 [Coemansia sp. RSA 1085]